MTAPKRPAHHPDGFSDAQKVELAQIIASSLKTELAPAIRAELKDAGLRLDGDANQTAATADFAFVRKFRLWFESTSSKIGGAVIMITVGGILSLLAYGMKDFFTK